MKRYTKKFLFIAISMIAVVLTFDLLTKRYIYGSDPKFLEGFISFYSTENTGAAWSIFSGKQTFLICLTIFMLAVLIVVDYFFVKNKSVLYAMSVGFIFGGAIGNLIDRIGLGYVRDFIKFDFFNFPIFNIADSFLCIGVGLLVLYMILEELKSYKEKKRKQNGKI